MIEKRPPHALDSINVLFACILIHFGCQALLSRIQDASLAGVVGILQQISWPAAVAALTFGRGIDPVEANALRLPSWRGAALSALLALSMFWILQAWIPVQEWLFDFFRYSPKADYEAVRREVERLKEPGDLFAISVVAVWTPFREEIVFRGLGLSGAARSWGWWRALLFVSILFGIVHESLGRFFITAALGFAFGLAVLCTRSVLAGMIAHALNNVLAIYVDPGPPGVPLLACAVVVLALVIAGLFAERSRGEPG